ncbi:hypothetical protein, partial [Neisseria sicca]|uniref:hypothetical protein n=1 Tax=Neisseria sicca TaxID=490 RepID=UPI003F68B385
GYHEAMVRRLREKLREWGDVMGKMAGEFGEVKMDVMERGTWCMGEGFLGMEGEVLGGGGIVFEVVEESMGGGGG